MDSIHFPILTDEERLLPLVVTTVGSWTNQLETIRPHGYPDYQWLQCTSGRGMFQWEGGGPAVEIAPGQGVLLYPDVPHVYRPLEEPWGIYWLGYHGALAQELTSMVHVHQSAAMTVGDPEQTLALIRRAISWLDRAIGGHGPRLSALAYELMMAWSECGRHDRGLHRKSGAQPLAPLLEWIHEHYQEDVSLQQMADRLQVSPQYVCTLFRRTFGLRPLQYVNRLRIRKSKQLLISCPDMAVAQVGKEAGFRHASYFLQRFKQQEHMTPVQFRQMYGRLPYKPDEQERMLLPHSM